MIKISLNSEQQQELEVFRKQASSKDLEKALMVLLNNDGKAVPEIALMLKRNHHTVICQHILRNTILLSFFGSRSNQRFMASQRLEVYRN